MRNAGQCISQFRCWLLIHLEADAVTLLACQEVSVFTHAWHHRRRIIALVIAARGLGYAQSERAS